MRRGWRRYVYGIQHIMLLILTIVAETDGGFNQSLGRLTWRSNSGVTTALSQKRGTPHCFCLGRLLPEVNFCCHMARHPWTRLLVLSSSITFPQQGIRLEHAGCPLRNTAASMHGLQHGFSITTMMIVVPYRIAHMAAQYNRVRPSSRRYRLIASTMISGSPPVAAGFASG